MPEVVKEDLQEFIKTSIEEGASVQSLGVLLMGAGAGLCKAEMTVEQLREIFEDGLKQLGL